MGEENIEYDNQLDEFAKSLEAVINKSVDDFEKQLSFITAGALVLSLSFIDKIVKNLPSSHYKWLLISGWILLVITLMLNLISHLVTARLHDKTLALVRKKDNSFFDKSNIANKVITVINWITIVTLTFGISFIIIFSSFNLLT